MNLNEQATDPISHTPVDMYFTFSGSGCHLLKSDDRPPNFMLRVETEVLSVGKTSFTVGQQVLRVVDGKLLADGKVTLVCVGPGMKARRLPEELLQALTL